MNTIIDTKTYKKYSIYSKKGKKILKNYIIAYNIGGGSKTKSTKSKTKSTKSKTKSTKSKTKSTKSKSNILKIQDNIKKILKLSPEKKKNIFSQRYKLY